MSGLAAGQTASAENGAKLALVIGGIDPARGHTSTAGADAGLVAQALAQAGFAVTAVGEADAPRLRKAAAVFTEAVQRASAEATVFVYVAGEGVQWSGDNFFVPVGAEIERQADVPAKAVSLGEIARPIEAARARAHIFVYDIARNSDAAKADAMPLAQGLALVRPPKGSLYAINAAPGAIVGADVPPFGRYARALAEALRTPGLTMRGIFERVRLRVAQASGGAIVPWHWSELDGEITPLPTEGPSVAPPVEDRPIAGLPVDQVFWAAIAEDSLTGYDTFLHAFPDDRLAVRIKALIAARLEAMTWSVAVEANTPAAYWTYMLRYPHGAHYVDVRRRLDGIKAALAPPPRFEVFDFAGLRAPRTLVPPLGDGRAVSLDTEAPPIPNMPRRLAPPVDAAFVDLPPPPLYPRGALPISLPLPAIAATTQSAIPSRIDNILVPHLSGLSIETVDAGRTMIVAARGKIVSRIAMQDAEGGRLVVQTDDVGRAQARMRVIRDGNRLTIVQTGPTNDVLIKTVSVTSPEGERTVTVTNGFNQLVAETQMDSRGVDSVVTFGRGALGAGLVLPPTTSNAAKPKMLSPRRSQTVERADEAPVAAFRHGGKATGKP